MTIQEITIRMPDDLHAHLRDADDPEGIQNLLHDVAPWTAQYAARALVMPNTKPPILTAMDVERYQEEIKAACGDVNFEPLMTAMLTQQTTPDDIQSYKDAGAIACKLYPKDATTNSHGGVSDLRSLTGVYAAMSDVGLVLCLHGEVPNGFSLRREQAFLHHLKWLAETFPRLRIVLEHITTADAVDAILDAGWKNVAATITSHHLKIDLDGVLMNPRLNSHSYCLPVPKMPEDREVLVRIATSGDSRFFWGTDSAPHIREKKECEGCAGAFTAPLALPLLAEIFESNGALDELEDFTSRFGAEFYCLPLNTRTITLVRKPWKVPEIYGRVVPFMAGQTLEWQVAR